MSQVKRITCKECGKRRVKATIVNPESGIERKTPAKICQECHSKVIDYQFFNSSFGQWLRGAFKRQCTESIPKTTEELGGVLMLWRACRSASGFYSDGETVSKNYKYELCHIDPVKGSDGKVGLLLAGNLVIAPSHINRKLSNLPYPATSGLSALGGEPIDDDNFREVCRERYDLQRLKRDFMLKPPKKGKGLSTFETIGVSPSKLLAMELNRLGFVTDLIIDDDEYPELVDSVFETFFKVGGALAVAELEGYQEYSRKAISGEISYNMQTPFEKIKESQKRRSASSKNEEVEEF